MPQSDDTLTQAHALTPERFARIRAVFEAALERKPAAREGYVDGACGQDDLLRKEVLRMLAAEAQPGALLDTPSHPPSSAPPSSSPEEGRFPAGTNLAGRYRILGMLGHGGMGEVYKAHDLILNQAVALKFLNPTHLSEAALMRFRNEVRIARQVSHPNVCRVYDLGMVEGLHFLSMEYIDGEDLASLLRRIGRLPQDKAIEFTRKICAGLGAAHERGVLHRDLKPANIMIDGRGQPRITDFGLAGLAAEIPLSDIRSGTPAYMSPEQKAGKEVTTRSDIYSLGLVLYEMFTGKQRKDSQSNPTDHVKDLDPAIERLILRCLEEDPKRRPAAPINVAMGLPGADPIAAALAAGETPSPEMVAASQEKEGFSARTAWLLFVGILVALAAGAAIQAAMISPFTRAPMPLPPDAMAERVRVFLRSIGYSEAGTESNYGYGCCNVAANWYVTGLDAAAQAKALADHRPAIQGFYYRQWNRGGSLPNTPREAFPDEDNSSEPSLIRVLLDSRGRLLRMDVGPGNYAATNAAVDWPRMFDVAQLDFTRFTAVPPNWNLTTRAEQRWAWEGDFSEGGTLRVRVEAGTRDGRPVLFWVQPQIGERDQPPGSLELLAVAVAGAILAGTFVLFIRNVRNNRGDRRGGYFILIASVVLLVGRFVLNPSPRAQTFQIGPLSVVLTAMLWPAYIAVEPYIRRYWPDSLISWSRFCSGKVRNSLVASHILVAVLVAEIWGVVLGPLVIYLVRHNGVMLSYARTLNGLDNVGTALSMWALSATEGLALALVFLVLDTILRLVLRRLWIADLLASALTVFIIGGPRIVALTMIGWLGFLWVLRRFGFLPFLTLWVIQSTILYTPLTLTGWPASRSLAVHLIPVVLGTWALWVILSSQRSSANTETA